MSKDYKDTIPVREGEELAPDKLKKFLNENLSDTPEGDLVVEQFGAGHSNLTYLLKIGDWEAVLRRPPLGPVAPKAHDMKREYTILKHLHPVYSTAPKPYIFSDDESIVGSPFFIMERRKGVFLDTDFPSDITYDKEMGKQISSLMVDKLVELHNVDYSKTELVNLAKPDGFIERQVMGWIKRYERAKTDEVDVIEKLKTYLENNIPNSQEPTIIHYDYKLNNALFSKDFKKMTGLFDWEIDRKSTRLNSSHVAISYAVFCLKKKTKKYQ